MIRSIGAGVKHTTKTPRAIHPKIFLPRVRGASISDGGCKTPTKRPIIKANNNHVCEPVVVGISQMVPY